MVEVGFVRRVAPAVILAAAGGLLLYLLPSGADGDTSAAEDIGFPEGSSAPAGSSAAPAASGKAGAPATASGKPGGAAKRVIQGDAVQFRFGTVQVKIALDGTTLTNIATITAPGGGYQPYTDRAIPGMKAKILAAQSTHVAAVSGATYTSKAYAQSVQSALDKA
jgi:uncharacterized protein with FMN-binding domain